jgi:hypothetical protein
MYKNFIYTFFTSYFLLFLNLYVLILEKLIDFKNFPYSIVKVKYLDLLYLIIINFIIFLKIIIAF